MDRLELIAGFIVAVIAVAVSCVIVQILQELLNHY